MLYPKADIPKRPQRNWFGRVICRPTYPRSWLTVTETSWFRTPSERTMDRLSNIRRTVEKRRAPPQELGLPRAGWSRWGWGGILGQLWLAECQRLDGPSEHVVPKPLK